MKITSPVKSKEFVERIIKAGAGELFGGVIDPIWQNKYGKYIEFNRRGSYGKQGNCQSYQEIGEIIQIADDYGVEFDLTINALQMWEEQIPYVRSILEKYKKVGGRNVIVSDLSIIPIAREYDFNVIISSCANVYNTYIAQYLKLEGCSKIIFPRDISVQEMRNISETVPDMQYEMFMMNSGCRFQDGNCLGVHNTRFKELCSFCGKEGWDYHRLDGMELSSEEKQSAFIVSEQYRRLLKHACGQCMIYPMKNWIDSVKVLERTGSEERLIELIQLTNSNICLADESKDYVTYLEKMTFPEQSECKKHMSCYYRTDMFVFKNQWASFCAEHLKPGNEGSVDFVGINISTNKSNYEFKVYHKKRIVEEAEDLVSESPVILKLAKNNMLSNVTRIERIDEHHRICLDFNLRNRTNENMKDVFFLVQSMGDGIQEKLPLIKKLASLEINPESNFKYASLYYMGCVETEKDGISALKLHFLTRKCMNPDCIFQDYYYDDAYYLERLKTIDQFELHKCLDLIEEYVLAGNAHLWMIGCDFFSQDMGNIRGKYKIYIKNVNENVLKKIEELLMLQGLNANFVERLREVDKCVGSLKSMYLYGIGICYELKKGYSFNLYLKPKRCK